MRNSAIRRSVCTAKMQVSVALVYSGSLLLLLQGCVSAVRGWRVFKNDATENIPDYAEETRSPEEPLQRANNTLNRAKQGVRSPGGRRLSGNGESYGEYLITSVYNVLETALDIAAHLGLIRQIFGWSDYNMWFLYCLRVPVCVELYDF